MLLILLIINAFDVILEKILKEGNFQLILAW